MNALNPSLSMSYYICSFISGLKDDINHILKIFKPITLMQAFDKVKWQEETMFWPRITNLYQEPIFHMVWVNQ
jgi:hypothetical protein